MNLLVLGAALAGILLVCEVVVRLVSPQVTEIQSRGMFTMDPVTGYRLTPNHKGYLGNRIEYYTHVEINDAGLRDVPVAPKSCAKRILFLGDSFVFGQGVEADQVISKRLEAALRQRGIDSEVFNAGVRGYSTRQEVAWFDTYGKALNPDMVILGVYLGNDVVDNSRAPEDCYQQPGSAAATAWYRDNPITRFLFVHSHLYFLLRKAPALLSAQRIDGVRVEPEKLMRNYGLAEDPERVTARQATEKAVAAFADSARASGTVPVAVLIPAVEQVAPWNTALASGLARQGYLLDWYTPNRIFIKPLHANNVQTLDLTEFFREAVTAGAQYYYPQDRHWTAAGHDAAAGLVAEFLVPYLESSGTAATAYGCRVQTQSRPTSGPKLGALRHDLTGPH